MKVLILIHLFCVTLFANPIFRADGYAQSRVSEQVALHDARSALWNHARTYCDFPAYVAHSGLCQASYGNQLWNAHCYGDFTCDNEATTSNYGPWPNESGELEFFLVPKTSSWWTGQKECWKLKAELPLLKDLRANFVYLNGTTPLGQHLKYFGAGSYYDIWTLEVEANQQAWTWNPRFPKEAQTFRQDRELAVVCIRYRNGN